MVAVLSIPVPLLCAIYSDCGEGAVLMNSEERQEERIHCASTRTKTDSPQTERVRICGL